MAHHRTAAPARISEPERPRTVRVALEGPAADGLAAIDLVCRLALVAKRLGWRLVVVEAGERLRSMLALAAVPVDVDGDGDGIGAGGSGVEVEGEPEGGEEPL